MDLNDIQQQHIDHLNVITCLNSPSGTLSNVCASAGFVSSVNSGDIFAVTQQLVSTNSFELNVATSLSDDSGVPLTNSSISSGDSYRLGLCKLELELVESDGEVSQLDSLGDSSDGGMSGENFNTLKKGPLAPIDPPPEFQDSPQTTMLRSGLLQNYAFNLSQHVIVTALNNWLPISKSNCEKNQKSKDFYFSSLSFGSSDKPRKEFSKSNNDYSNHIYASDSLLNKCYDIYDDPEDNLLSSSGQKLNIATGNNQHDYIFIENHSQDLESKTALLKPMTQVLTSSNENNHESTEIYNQNFYYALKKNYQNENCYQSHRKTPSVLYSPLHHHPYHNGSNVSNLNRPNSRNSLNSRLSSSHNSLTVPNANKADDSIFITQAMSHDALLTQEISDFYNVPIGADIYSFPIDMIEPPLLSLSSQQIKYLNNKRDIGCNVSNNGKVILSKSRFKSTKNNKKRRRSNNNTATNEASGTDNKLRTSSSSKTPHKRHSVPEDTITPLHMTLDEVKKFYHSLYSSASDSSESLARINNNNKGHIKTSLNNNEQINLNQNACGIGVTSTLSTTTNNIKSTTKPVNLKYVVSNEKAKHNNRSQLNKNEDIRHSQCTITGGNNKYATPTNNRHTSEKKSQFFISLNLKQKFCNIFRFRKNNDNRRSNSSIFEPPDYISNNSNSNNRSSNVNVVREDNNKFISRALPPLPTKNSFQNSDFKSNKKDQKKSEFNSAIHFASNIEKVKDYGWYWGPISSEAAEKILSNEPDGSFIVRDSSDDHYIFSLSFKLNNCVRHVRIEQDQGTFSFGSYAKFKSQTITEFIEKAVEHSRSGRYLFFLHRRPEHGPMRVQLTNPVSRFKHIQSLQHMCRFVILKAVVRKDLIPNLPLPRRLLDYLSYKHCYSEQVECESSSQSQSSGDGGA